MEAKVRRGIGFLVGLVAFATTGRAQAHGAPLPEQRPRGSLTGFGLASKTGVAIDNGAFAISLGGRFAFSDHWISGVDIEYNPWFNLSSGQVARGVMNAFGTMVYRYPISRHFALRSTLNLGLSMLLFDTVAAPKGSVGPYIGLSLLGLSYEIRKKIYLTIDPADVSLPVPQLKGAPFSYRQYRLSVGLQWGA